MIRNLLGGVAGYVIYFLSVLVLFTTLSVGLGPDRLFRPGNYDPSLLWIIGAFIIGLISAVLGGYVAALIGKRGAVKVLAGIVVLIGVIVLAGLLRETKAVEPRTVELPTMEAMFKAREPLWFAAINPLLLLLAVFNGGAVRKRRAAG